MDLGFEIFAEILRNDARLNEYTQIRNRYVWEKREDRCERRIGIAHQSQTNVVGLGPFHVVDDGLNYVCGNSLTRESFQHMGFGKKRIVESERKNLRVALSEQCAGNTARSAAR